MISHIHIRVRKAGEAGEEEEEEEGGRRQRVSLPRHRVVSCRLFWVMDEKLLAQGEETGRGARVSEWAVGSKLSLLVVPLSSISVIVGSQLAFSSFSSWHTAFLDGMHLRS